MKSWRVIPMDTRIYVTIKFKKFNLFVMKLRIICRCIFANYTEEQISDFIQNEVDNNPKRYVKVITEK